MSQCKWVLTTLIFGGPSWGTFSRMYTPQHSELMRYRGQPRRVVVCVEKKKFDKNEIRTHAGRTQWLTNRTVVLLAGHRLNHSAILPASVRASGLHHYIPNYMNESSLSYISSPSSSSPWLAACFCAAWRRACRCFSRCASAMASSENTVGE